MGVCAVHSVWSIVPDSLSYLTNDTSLISDANELTAMDSK